MSTRRDFLKQVIGAVVAPAVVPAPLVPNEINLHEEASKALAEWIGRQKAMEVSAAILAGHQGPWTFEYTPDGRKLVDGKGVVCG